MTRATGAFISVWSDDARNQLKENGFIENGVDTKIYNGKQITVHKYKASYSENDDHKQSFLREKEDNISFHHLDFYLDKTNKLMNTDVYTT